LLVILRPFAVRLRGGRYDVAEAFERDCEHFGRVFIEVECGHYSASFLARRLSMTARWRR